MLGIRTTTPTRLAQNRFLGFWVYCSNAGEPQPHGTELDRPRRRALGHEPTLASSSVKNPTGRPGNKGFVDLGASQGFRMEG